ncbi:MAG: hypothetical protein AMJ90_08065 [candidate division Zixibacteria bacterium SM23_73_2]|nr:MAG: hypothetical protein AMJ90_08065 [candidate division Zixibacteria bacterium SM23_73_2]
MLVGELEFPNHSFGEGNPRTGIDYNSCINRDKGRATFQIGLCLLITLNQWRGWTLTLDFICGFFRLLLYFF